MYYTQTIEFCTEEGWSIAAQFTLVMIITICIMSTTACSKSDTLYRLCYNNATRFSIYNLSKLQFTIQEGYSKYSSQITAYILHYVCLTATGCLNICVELCKFKVMGSQCCLHHLAHQSVLSLQQMRQQNNGNTSICQFKGSLDKTLPEELS